MTASLQRWYALMDRCTVHLQLFSLCFCLCNWCLSWPPTTYSLCSAHCLVHRPSKLILVMESSCVRTFCKYRDISHTVKPPPCRIKPLSHPQYWLPEVICPSCHISNVISRLRFADETLNAKTAWSRKSCSEPQTLSQPPGASVLPSASFIPLLSDSTVDWRSDEGLKHKSSTWQESKKSDELNNDSVSFTRELKDYGFEVVQTEALNISWSFFEATHCSSWSRNHWLY